MLLYVQLIAGLQRSELLLILRDFGLRAGNFLSKDFLGTEVCSDAFIDGSLVIFRLAPQDYHRFHFPVSGRIEKFVDILGCPYTVALVAIGATMVGSITFSKKEGDSVKKGDEFGYFSFGGSTVICVLEKDMIKLDDDLLENSERSLESLVSVGMKLGVSFNKGTYTEFPNVESRVIGE